MNRSLEAGSRKIKQRLLRMKVRERERTRINHLLADLMRFLKERKIFRDS